MTAHRQPMIVGITGRAGAGKDTAAIRLEAEAVALGFPTMRISFMEPVRAMLRAMGVPHAFMVDRALKEEPIPGIGRSYRQLAQSLGTEWGRDLVDRNLWMNVALRRIHDQAQLVGPAGLIAFVPDVRLHDEAVWVRAHGGVLLRLTRPGFAPVAAHSSEEEVGALGVDIDLLNDSTLEDFEARIRALARGIFNLAAQRTPAALAPAF